MSTSAAPRTHPTGSSRLGPTSATRFVVSVIITFHRRFTATPMSHTFIPQIASDRRAGYCRRMGGSARIAPNGATQARPRDGQVAGRETGMRIS